MRKRNISFLFDKLLWFLILLLPLIFALAFTFSSMNNYKLNVDDVSLEGYDYSFEDITQKQLIINGNGFNDFKSTIYLGQEILTENSHISFYIDNYYYEMYFDDSIGLLDYENDSPYFIYNGLVDIDDIIYCQFEVHYYLYDMISSIYGTGDFSLVFYESYDYVTTLPFDMNAYVVSNFVLPSNDNIFNTYFNNLNYCLDSWMNYSNTDLVYTAFNNIFGTNGLLPIFTSSSFLPKYLTYMCWVFILHLIFDFLVFIPRLAHKWMGDIYRDGDD